MPIKEKTCQIVVFISRLPFDEFKVVFLSGSAESAIRVHNVYDFNVCDIDQLRKLLRLK